ncbi:hypothetical protein F511_28442 [Dorcoceras hygrometricum]|uniref:Uncharacterized protein n=1 Tax=Dorcoceras hygrometricum TaxID=472368 RepID=A0A2Z7B741_9LAMI|nr:hypothetical protein F511_28442 [Dorcoceras hygrometricum]
MSLFDLQDVCIAIGSIATLDLPMVVDLIGIYGLKGPYFSRGNRHFTVDCGRQRQSGPRPETVFLRQPALESLMRSVRTDSPRKIGRNNFRRTAAAAATSGGGGGVF